MKGPTTTGVKPQRRLSKTRLVKNAMDTDATYQLANTLKDFVEHLDTATMYQDLLGAASMKSPPV